MKNFFRILITTALIFIILDALIGKNFYKKFLRKSFVDRDVSFGLQDEFYHHKYKKNFSTKNAKWGHSVYNFCTDENGFRTFCGNNKTGKKFDIGIIGDSFTEGIGLNYENSFVGLIEHKLNNLKIANLGSPSYSPSIYYTKIVRLLEQGYEFNEIIVFLDISDIYDDNVCYELIGKKTKSRKPPNGLKDCRFETHDFREKILIFLNKNLKLSHELIVVSSSLLEKYGLKEPRLKHWIINNPRSDLTHNYNKKFYSNKSREEAYKLSLDIMKKLSDFLLKNDIKLSIAVYPWPGTLKNDKSENIHTKAWGDFCKNKCNKFYNLMPPFFEKLQENNLVDTINEYYIKDDVHFNKNGNKIIANNFLKEFKR